MAAFLRMRLRGILLVALKFAAPLAGVLLCVTAHSAITPTGDVSPQPITPNTALQIANTGIGTLVIDGGSTLTSSFLLVGQGLNGVGTAIVRDPGTMWRVTGGADIGNNGIGRLEVRNGAIFEVPSPAPLMRIGNNQVAHGTVFVDGPGSLLQIIAPFTVGQQGTALLQASNGAIVNVPEDSTTIGTTGRIELDNALMRTNALQNGGTIIGSGELAVLSSGSAVNSGRIEAGPGDRLVFGGSTGGFLQNNGAIVADGGELEFRRMVTNVFAITTAPRITLQDGIVRFPFVGTSQPGLQNSSLLAAIGSENHVYGRISNLSSGQIVATNETTIIFHQDVTSQGNITVAAGSTAIFLEDLVMPGGTLFADLGGEAGFGHAEVYGEAQLGSGALQIGLSSGYVPAAGDTFQLLTAAGGISGTLSLVDIPNPSNLLEWDLDIEPNVVTLSVAPALDGDYNANGTVDAADYIVWRTLLNQSGPGLVADGDDNGVVNAADYDFWRSRFGNAIAGSAHSAVTNVPEPGTMAICWIAALLALLSMRRSNW